MLARSDWIVSSPRNRWGRKVKIAHHFTASFDTRAMLSENTARMGDEGKAVRRGGADGFAVSATLVGLWILTRIKERECDPECVLSADLYLKKAQRYYFRTRLGPPNWWPFSFPVWNSRLPVLVTARSSIEP